MTLLELASTGDLVELRRRLEIVVARFDVGGKKLSEGEQLLIEALTYTKLGDLDEATHRLQMRARPKWKYKEQCQADYDAAMGRKKRGKAA